MTTDHAPLAVTPTRNDLAAKLLLIVVSTVISLAIAELALRYLLFHPSLGIGGRLRDPALYGDYFSDDDYWKLYLLFDTKYRPPANPHPVLGWIGDFDPDTYVHHDAAGSTGKRPVLLYGDSFSGCTEHVRCFQDILNGDGDFGARHHLLNYGVSGYGVDQIRLLLLRSVDRFTDPIVIVGILTEDLDRSVLRIRVGQKPRFSVQDGTLRSVGDPIERSTETYLAEHPPEIWSYLYRIVAHDVVPQALPSSLRDRFEETSGSTREKRELNAALIRSIVVELQHRGLPFVFVVFRAQWPTPVGGEDWRDRFLGDVMRELDVPVIWTKPMILAAAASERRPVAEFFVADGHPTSHLNELIAAAMKGRVRELEDASRAGGRTLPPG